MEFEIQHSNSNQGVMSSTEQSRAVAEVQSAMVIAKRFPRDQNAAFGRIMKSCQRKVMAEQAMYAYPRGGQTVTGPSIRLAEALAQNWGNIDFGIIELEQRNGESTMMTYAIDLETNVKQSRVFIVKHERTTKKGTQQLEDARDIYELTANNGARRLRACILGVLPGDVIEAAIEQCEKTLKGASQEPLIDRTRKMVLAFSDLGISQEMIEKRLAHKIDAIIEQELLSLRKIYQSLKDGFANRADFFDIASGMQSQVDDALSDAIKKTAPPKKAAAPKEESKTEPEKETEASKIVARLTEENQKELDLRGK